MPGDQADTDVKDLVEGNPCKATFLVLAIIIGRVSQGCMYDSKAHAVQAQSFLVEMRSCWHEPPRRQQKLRAERGATAESQNGSTTMLGIRTMAIDGQKT